MLSRFFSCCNAATEKDQVDLSKQNDSNPFKPQMHPESNVNGLKINFEEEDDKDNSMHLNFLA